MWYHDGKRAPPPAQHKTQTRERTCGRAADRRRWREAGAERRLVVHCARRAETASGGLGRVTRMAISRAAVTAVEEQKEAYSGIPPWPTLDFAKEQDIAHIVRLKKAYPSQIYLQLSVVWPYGRWIPRSHWKRGKTEQDIPSRMRSIV